MSDKKEFANAIIYRCIYVKVKSICNDENVVERKKLNNILGYFFHIPKELRESFIKELEAIGMVKKINRDNILVLE